MKSILRFMIPKSLVEYITVDSTVRQALEKMHFHKYTAIPVLDSDGKYIGTLRNDDLLTYLWKGGSCDKESAEMIPISTLLSVQASCATVRRFNIRETFKNLSIRMVFTSHNFLKKLVNPSKKRLTSFFQRDIIR